MIKLKVIDQGKDHFVISADEPVRVEVIHARAGLVTAHVYQGTKVDEDQEPVGAYDGYVHNTDWCWTGLDDLKRSLPSYDAPPVSLNTSANGARAAVVEGHLEVSVGNPFEGHVRLYLALDEVQRLFAYLQEQGWPLVAPGGA